VQRHVADLAAAHHQLAAAVHDRLDLRLQQVLLALGEVLELVGGLDEDGALGLGGGDVDRAAVEGDLALAGLGHAALDLAPQHHALHDRRAEHARAQDLAHAHVVHVEGLVVLEGFHLKREKRWLKSGALACWVTGEPLTACVAHQVGQEILEAQLLA